MANIRIETLSPVHIGNGRFLQNNVEFTSMERKDANGDSIKELGVFDDMAIVGVIGEENINKWVSTIEKGESVVAMIKQRKPNVKLRDISSRIIRNFGQKQKYISLKEQLHDGKELPYIPGSTIKGAIRSAIFNVEMSRKNQIKESDLLDNRNRLNSKKLEGEIFGADPNHDFMRFFKIGDAYFEKESTIAMELNSLNIVKDGASVIKDNKTAQLIEAITSEETSCFRLEIDKEHWIRCSEKNFLKKPIDELDNINDLFSLINQNTLLLLNNEIDFWSENKNSEDDVVEEYIYTLENIIEVAQACVKGNECVLRLGHGMGWTFIAGNWMKNRKLVDDKLWGKIKTASRPLNDKIYSKYEFPKTRRIDEDFDLLGFVKLSVD